MTDDPTGLDTKLTRTKQSWARERKFITGRVARPETDRLPPGQHLVKDWPVLDLGEQPAVDTARFTLDVDGAVTTRAHWTWAELMALPQSRFVTDIHCVTTWSRYDNAWQGISTHTILDAVMPTVAATHVMLHSSDGYTTNVPLPDFAAEDAILAHTWNGEPLAREHGGPLRLVIPHLYFWKSAKWLKRIEFMTVDRRGFWEENGYHDRGDPWTEQRYQGD